MCILISVKSLHSFGLEAKVQDLIEIHSIEQLSKLAGKQLGKDFILIGEGSNIVFLEDYPGLLVSMKLKGIEINEHKESYTLKAQAGENWHSLVEQTLSQGIYGLENLALIPGSVGACPVQNIGAYGVEIERFIETVQFFDLETGDIKQLTKSECNFSYRDSIFKSELKNKAIITSVTFSFPKDWKPVNNYGELAKLEKPTAKHIFDIVIKTRVSKLPDPNVLGNAGSFFKNPILPNDKLSKLIKNYPELPVYPWSESESKVAAGWLIDKTGLKGIEVEGAAVHMNQALVLINKSGTAKSEDLIKLIQLVQTKVSAKFDITLEPEVRMFDRSGEVSFDEFLRKSNG